MQAMKLLLSCLCAVSTILAAGAATGQAFPVRPVRIVTTEAGGSLDFTGRLIGLDLAGRLGQPVVVENRGGAGGAIAIETVVKAPPDGYTLLVYGSAIWLLPAMRSNLSWDPVRDLVPVTMAVHSPNILLVFPSVAAKSVRELVDLARAKPGELNYASAGPGSTAHIAAELFKAMAGVNIVHVPYKGGGPAINSLLGGHEQMMFPPVAAAIVSHVKAGRLRALAVTSAQPSALLPGLPTLASSGLPGYEAESKVGVFVPAKTPRALVSRLNQEIVSVLNRPETRERFFNSGMEVWGSSADEAASTSKAELAKLRKLVREIGIRGE